VSTLPKQRVAVCCTALQCVAVCCSVLKCVAACVCVCTYVRYPHIHLLLSSVISEQYCEYVAVAVCCSVLQCVAACIVCVCVCMKPPYTSSFE